WSSSPPHLMAATRWWSPRYVAGGVSSPTVGLRGLSAPRTRFVFTMLFVDNQPHRVGPLQPSPAPVRGGRPVPAERRPFMPYVIGEPCIDVMDRACVEECPVDCIYEGGRSLYIQPDECVDCGACEPVCPVEAIYYEDDLPADLQPYLADNARFFAEPLPGRDEPLGSPGGAAKVGPLGVDTELVAALPRRS